MAYLGKYYYIVSRMNGLVLDIKDGSDDSGTPIIMWEKKEGEPDNQLWYDDFETMTIRSKQNGMCMTIKDGELCIDDYEDDNEDQKWIFRRAKGTIQNGDDRDAVLDIEDADDDAGSKVIVYEEHGGDNQMWDCDRVMCRAFKIRSRMNGLVVDIKSRLRDDGAKIHMKEDEDSDSQYWFEDDSNVIRSQDNGYALCADADDDGDCVRVCEFEPDNEDQHWMRTHNGLIVNRYNREMAFDFEDADDGEGAKVIVFERHGNDNQQFDFEFR